MEKFGYGVPRWVEEIEKIIKEVKQEKKTKKNPFSLSELKEKTNSLQDNGNKIQRQIYFPKSEINYVKHYQKIFSRICNKELSFSHTVRLLMFRRIEDNFGEVKVEVEKRN